MNNKKTWPDGCYRILNENGTEKESKVIAAKEWGSNIKYWYWCFRDSQGNILKEYYGERIKKS
jgi:hypothetical protein